MFTKDPRAPELLRTTYIGPSISFWPIKYTVAGKEGVHSWHTDVQGHRGAKAGGHAELPCPFTGRWVDTLNQTMR